MYTVRMVLDLNPKLEQLIRESVQKGSFPTESAVIEASLESFFARPQGNAHHWKDIAEMFAENPTDGSITNMALNHDHYLTQLEHESA